MISPAIAGLVHAGDPPFVPRDEPRASREQQRDEMHKMKAEVLTRAARGGHHGIARFHAGQHGDRRQQHAGALAEYRRAAGTRVDVSMDMAAYPSRGDT